MLFKHIVLISCHILLSTLEYYNDKQTMMKLTFLINIIFSHEYYNECIPSEIFEIEPRRTNRVVLGGPKYPFRQTGRNQYALIGDREELLDHLSTSPDGLNLEFQAHSKDPKFFTVYTIPATGRAK